MDLGRSADIPQGTRALSRFSDGHSTDRLFERSRKPATVSFVFRFTIAAGEERNGTARVSGLFRKEREASNRRRAIHF